MALREDDSRDPKRETSFFDQISRWAGLGVKVAVVAVPVFASLHYMIQAEIAPVKQQIANVEGRLEGLEGRLEGLEGRMDGRMDRLEGRVDKLDDKLDRFIETMADFRVEVLTWMARNESPRQTSSGQSDGGHEGHADASSPPLEGSAQAIPVARFVAAEDGHGC